jgi:hypothetical protein
MGFLNRLVGAIGGSSGPGCPTCGATLDGEEMVEGSYWCEGCGCLVLLRGGQLVVCPPGHPLVDTHWDGIGLDGIGPGDDCTWCQSSLNGGTSYLPYEDGSNRSAYIICPSCGGENIRDGFGED